ncbi:hypothetical protein [Jiella sonneratiae]|uniref:Uncharacterized protein n=1 Tax=Jiella sonneratiae TaxID=2816856 RepID=A0ABS3IZA4_9HYPH|nr:hypothetical protein [Jiella sonneratiae]MBO0902761.1 hypothetical protein [Jiella sonneratiae]
MNAMSVDPPNWTIDRLHHDRLTSIDIPRRLATRIAEGGTLLPLGHEMTGAPPSNRFGATAYGGIVAVAMIVLALANQSPGSRLATVISPCTAIAQAIARIGERNWVARCSKAAERSGASPARARRICRAQLEACKAKHPERNGAPGPITL